MESGTQALSMSSMESGTQAMSMLSRVSKAVLKL